MHRPLRLALRGTACALSALVVAVSLLSAPAANAAPAAPRSLSPSSGSQADVPTLRWARVAGAARYDVQVSTSSTFSTTLVATSTTNSRYVPSVQLPATRIYWRVRTVTASRAVSAWSKAAFSRSRLAGPTLQSPAHGETLPQPFDPPVLTWSPIPNASGYEVMIDNDSDFIGATSATTSTTSYLVPDPQPATTFWWRVRAVRASGLNTYWSTARSYTIGGLPEVLPTLPAEGAELEDIVLDWPAVPGAKDYELRVSDDEDFNTLITGRTIVVKSTRYSPPVTFDNDEYWWQVRARDNLGNSIAWDAVDSEGQARVPVRSFQRHWADAPQLEFPADAAQAGDPLFFQWSPVDHASRYRFDMGTDPNFSPNTFKTCYTKATTLTPGIAGSQSNASCTPQPGQVTYWRVQPLDEPFTGGGVEGLWSGVRSFVYRPGMVTPSAPANGSTVAVPTLRWEAVRDAEKYHVEVYSNAGSRVASTDTYALSWTPTTTLSPDKGPYRWVVTSLDNNGHRSPAPMTGDQWTFDVTSEPPLTGAAPLTPLGASPTSMRFPVLRWEPHPEATSYTVYVGAAGGDLFQVASKHAYPHFTDVSKNYLATRSYDWVVEAYNGTEYLGQGSTGRFTIEDLPPVTGQKLALTGTALDTNACNKKLADSGVNFCDDLVQTPVLDWNPSPEASHYLVYLYRDQEMTNPVYSSPHYVVTQNTRWTPHELLADSQAGEGYFWFVRPCKADGVCAPDPLAADKSATHSFDKRSHAVDLVSPAAGATVQNELVLSWQDNLANLQEPGNGQILGTGSVSTTGTVEAKQYRVQISDDRSFAKVLEDEVVDQTTYTPYSLTFPEGPLYWRVQVVDGSNNSLTWSEPRTINKQSPPVSTVAPSSGASVSTTPFFRWQSQDFAAGYSLEVYDDNDTTLSSSNRVLSTTTKQAAYTLTKPLPTSSLNYLWRVRRLDADGKPGRWSPVQSFKVTGRAPALVSPSSSAFVRGNNAFFSWKPVTGASSYYFERRSYGSTYSSERVTTYAQSWAPTSTITDGRWQWRVSAVDANRRTMASTGWRTFHVDSKRPGITRRLPATSPRPYRSANWSVTFSEPVRRVSGTTMRLYRSGRSTPVRARITSSNGGRTWTLNPSSLMAGKVRYTLKLSSGIADRAGNTLPATSYTRTVR